MIRFSRREDYSVIFVHKLVENYNKRLIPLSEIAKEYKISILFLRNLVNELRKAGIVKAVEGKRGGYFLAKTPQGLKIGDVLSVFSPKPILECCPTPQLKRGKKTCDKIGICEPGHIWRKLNKEFLEKIYNLSFTDFISYRNNLL